MSTVYLVMYRNGYDSWDVIEACDTEELAKSRTARFSKDDPGTIFDYEEYALLTTDKE